MQCSWCNKYIEPPYAPCYSGSMPFCSTKCKVAYEKAAKAGHVPDPHSGCTYIVELVIGGFIVIAIAIALLSNLFSKKQKDNDSKKEIIEATAPAKNDKVNNSTKNY